MVLKNHSSKYNMEKHLKCLSICVFLSIFEFRITDAQAVIKYYL